LWKTEKGFVGEPCNQFILVVINKVIYAATEKKILSNKSISFTDMHNMSPAPNNCGGNHNSDEIHHLSTDILVAPIKLLPNLKTIIRFVKHPSLFGVNHLLPKLKEEQYKDLLPRFQPAFRKGNEAIFRNLHIFITLNHM